MALQPPANTPPDLLLLLGRIDGKVDGIAGTLASMNTRADIHETRIRELETNDAARATFVPRFLEVEKDVDALKSAQDQGRGWLQAGAAVKAAIVCLIGVIGYLGYQVSVEPTPAPAIQHKTVETTTIPVQPTPTNKAHH